METIDQLERNYDEIIDFVNYPKKKKVVLQVLKDLHFFVSLLFAYHLLRFGYVSL